MLRPSHSVPLLQCFGAGYIYASCVQRFTKEIECPQLTNSLRSCMYARMAATSRVFGFVFKSEVAIFFGEFLSIARMYHTGYITPYLYIQIYHTLHFSSLSSCLYHKARTQMAPVQALLHLIKSPLSAKPDTAAPALITPQD